MNISRIKSIRFSPRRPFGAALVLFFLFLFLSVPALAETYDCTALGHKFSETGRVPATAENDGGITYKCDFCGFEYTDVLPATSHNWSAWVIDLPPTCTTAGIRHRTCTVHAPHDQTEAISPLGHDYRERITKNPSCFEDGVRAFTCTHEPENTYTEAIPAYGGHDFGEWAVETAAKNGAPGVEARFCARDEYKETREIPATPEPEKPLFKFTALDIVLGGTETGLPALFGALVGLNARWLIRDRKMRKLIQSLKRRKGG
ncbi:MAG: hypothetical protein LBQ48_02390 [Oscillospiraceae bacterium]|jgi:hypothetical protein|nr:hypothetical protein [Oscillospiraceae bacterium]